VKDDDSVGSAEGEIPEGEAPEANEENDMDGASGANDMMAKLMGGGMGDLSSSMGGGSNKFSGMGGFGNKFGTGQVGPKVGFNNNVGAGFQDLPKFNAKKSKMLAANKRAVFSKGAAGRKGKYGKGAFNQSKGVKRTQTSYSGGTVDGMRATQDAAWEGTTGDGLSTGGGGLGSAGGGEGIVTSPSLDEGGSAGGGGSSGADNSEVPDDTIPDVPSPDDVSPWASLASQAMMLLMLAATFSAIGSAFVKASYTATGTIFGAPLGAVLYAIGIAFCVIAAALAAAVIAIGMKIMVEHGQSMLGIVYMVGGACALTASLVGMAGLFGMVASFSPMWIAAAAGVLALIGSTMGTPTSSAPKGDNIEGDNELTFEDTRQPGNNTAES
ncbi:MAG: hypothetical protein KAI33_08835, partial [Elusimicrobiales bacterium]|nr:hypothetical protein [Elusimicrobiales bacterium]